MDFTRRCRSLFEVVKQGGEAERDGASGRGADRRIRGKTVICPRCLLSCGGVGGSISFEADLTSMMKAKEDFKGPSAGIVAYEQKGGGAGLWQDGQADNDDVALEELVKFFGAQVLGM